MTADVHILYRKPWCAEDALEIYAQHLGADVTAIPVREQCAVMYAAVASYRAALEPLDEFLEQLKLDGRR